MGGGGGRGDSRVRRLGGMLPEFFKTLIDESFDVLYYKLASYYPSTHIVNAINPFTWENIVWSGLNVTCKDNF